MAAAVAGGADARSADQSHRGGIELAEARCEPLPVCVARSSRMAACGWRSGSVVTIAAMPFVAGQVVAALGPSRCVPQ